MERKGSTVRTCIFVSFDGERSRLFSCILSSTSPFTAVFFSFFLPACLYPFLSLSHTHTGIRLCYVALLPRPIVVAVPFLVCLLCCCCCCRPHSLFFFFSGAECSLSLLLMFALWPPPPSPSGHACIGMGTFMDKLLTGWSVIVWAVETMERFTRSKQLRFTLTPLLRFTSCASLHCSPLPTLRRFFPSFFFYWTSGS